MKAYGLSRREAGDVDIAGCRCNGRSTHIASRSHQLHSLRGGKKNTTRRILKRLARNEGRRACSQEEE